MVNRSDEKAGSGASAQKANMVPWTAFWILLIPVVFFVWPLVLRELAPKASAEPSFPLFLSIFGLIIVGLALAHLWPSLSKSQRLVREVVAGDELMRRALNSAGVVAWSWELKDRSIVLAGELALLGGAGVRPREFFDRVHPRDSGRVRAVLDRSIRTGEPFEVEFRLLGPSGEANWVVDRGSVEKGEDGSAVRLIGACTDIDEYVQERRVIADRAISDQMRITHAIADRAESALFVTDPDGKCVFMNSLAERVFGFTFAELKDKDLHEKIHFKRPTGEEFPAELCEMRDAYLNGREAVFEDSLIEKGGRHIDCLICIRPLKEDGRVIATLLECKPRGEARHESNLEMGSEAISNLIE